MQIDRMAVVSDLINKVCTIMLFLEDDPHYTKHDAYNDLKLVLSQFDDLYQSAKQNTVARGR